MTNIQNFKEGIRDGVPICLGYFAVSFAFGIQAADIHLSPFQAGLLSLLNVTSAGQFAGLAVIAQAGTYLEMAVLQAIVNLRYLLMSAALSQKLSPETPTAHRLGIAYGVTDEIFGISVLRKGDLSPFYSYGAIFISVFGWVAGTVLGASAGAILPQRLISALGIALYGMFIAIIIPPAREDRTVLATVIGGMALSTVFTYAPFVKDISGGMRIIIVTVVVASVAAVARPVDGMEGEA
ncbi:MAG: AzlC family ABC transporter permease [Lachnospiraceae bacterium]|nr:AzlC family ABC transporter permease [Lachnospiraceae bacterium]